MSAPVETPARWRLAAAFAAVYVIWGSTYLAIRFGVETLPPFLMTATRFLVAGAILLAGARLRGRAPLARHWRPAAVVGAFLIVGGNGLVVWAEQWVASGLAALVVATIPLWMTLLAWLAGDGPRPGGPVVAGLVLGFGAVWLLAGPVDGATGAGMVALVLASLFWAVGSIYARRAPLPESPMLGTALQMLTGGALALVVGSLLGEWGRFDPAAVSGRSVLALLYLVAAGSVVAFSCYVWLLKVSTPARVSTYAYVNPIIAVLLGWVLAGEPLTARTLAAGAGILAAVLLINAPRRRPVAPSPEGAAVKRCPAT